MISFKYSEYNKFLMGNTLAWPMIRLVRRFCMVLTLGCSAYVVLFLFSKNHDNFIPIESSDLSAKGIGRVSPSPVFDLRPYDASANAQARDIFSSTTSVDQSGSAENTPKGQLPVHLKIVGILIAHPSQIIIEDALLHKTYFIDEAHPQDGISIVRGNKDQMTITYRGSDISVPVGKN